MKYDLTLQAPTEFDRQEWIRALRMHQCDLFRSRATILEGWLERQGVALKKAKQSVFESQFLENFEQEEMMASKEMPKPIEE